MAEETILDEVDLTTEDGEDNALNFPPLAQFGNEKSSIPGLIASARVDDSASEPYAENGTLVIPRGMIQGEITSVQPGAGWSVSDGVVQVGYASGGAPGVISGAEISKTTSKVPVIGNGVIIIPLAQADIGANGTTANTPGAISGIEYVAGICVGIVDGIIQLPKPVEHQFDDAWFEVNDGIVTLKNDALASVVDDLAAEMSVEVTGTGILEQTYAGTLKANTSGNLTLDTFVTY